MKIRTRSIGGLDIQKEYISIAQYKPDEHAVALVAIQPIQIGDSADMWSVIQQQMKELRSKFKFASSDVVCSLPSDSAVVKRIQLDEDENDVEGTLTWELSQNIIGSIDEYSFDFQETGLSPESRSKDYLAVAYRNQVVNQLTSVTKGVKLNPVVIDLDIFALINVFEANYKELLSTPTLIIHGENDCTKVVLTQQGNFLDYTSFNNIGAGMDPAAFAERLQEEIAVFLTGKNMLGQEMQYYAAGALFADPLFVNATAQQLGHLEILFPFRKVGCHIGVEEERLRSYASQLAVAVGLALRGND